MPPPHQETSSSSLCDNTTGAQPGKRKAAAKVDSPSKRTRLARTAAAGRVAVATQQAQAAKTIPKTKPSDRGHTAVLEPVAFPLEPGGQYGTGDKPRCHGRPQLTRENLALLNKMGKKKAAQRSAFGLESTADSARTTSTTSSGFAVLAYKNGILRPGTSKPPANLEDIRRRAAEPRGTASPPRSEYERYVTRVDNAVNEATMAYVAGPRLLKEYDEGYTAALNQAFTAFPRDVGFNNGLSAPQPDFIEGLRMEDYAPVPVDELSGAVLYKDNPRSVTLPHLAGEWKGPGKDMEEARLQSAYDGAAMVYARNQALAHLGEPDPPGHAQVTTFATDGTNINLYAHYAAPSDEDNNAIQYHQYLVKSASLIDSHQAFKDARRHLRNEQDRAWRESHSLRDRLKENWRKPAVIDPSSPEDAPLCVPEGSTNELGPDEIDVICEPCQPTPTASELRTAPSSLSSSKSISSGKKRKAPSVSSHKASKQKSKLDGYWNLDAETGQYFHVHSDDTITWLKDPNLVS